LEAFFDKAKKIDTIQEAEALLWSLIPQAEEATKEAFALSIKAHEGQKRKSGEPYVVHPILVAAITANISNDQMMVQAALLHDVVEDTAYSIDDLIVSFGADVAHMVEGLTKIVHIRDEELVSAVSEERLIKSALSFRKMLIASIKDVRVLVIKLCDRVHNMLTLDALMPDKQKRIAEETLVVYAPIAHRLGISQLKNHLEDLSFYYIYPEDYKNIDDYIKNNAQNLHFKLNNFIYKVKTFMLQNGFDEDEFEVFGRVKHYYSIYTKMQRKGVSIEEVLDLLAVRIVVKEPLECYRVLGLMHLSFTPLISRFKDYIAVPKENGYKTIHSTIFSENGIIEAQIRTEDMHHLAEYGIAAHWKYKGGDGDAVNLRWLESLHYKHDSVKEFYELAKCDLFSEDITIFSPDGDAYTLPKDSTALDFAYAVHSEVGNTAIDAVINKKNASLLTVLKNSDMVNIIKDDNPHLHCSWIDTVKTSKAQEGMRSLCKARLKENNIKSAYNILQTLFKEDIEGIKALIKAFNLEENIEKLPEHEPYFKEIIHKFAEHTGTKEVRVWELFKKGYKKPKAKELEHFHFFTNKSIDTVVFDYCCHPKVGDHIVAFYEDSKAIIHHKLCKNAYEKICNHEQMLYVNWTISKHSHYRLTVSLQNQKGRLADLLVKLSQLNLNVLSIELGIKRSEEAESCQIEVESREANKAFFAEQIGKNFKLIEILSLDDAYNK
jgi:RelA/SpoT family (p)ppGpp synthetase